MPDVIEVLKGLLPGSQWLPEVDPKADFAKHARSIEGLYTFMVQVTIAHPNPRLSKLGKHLWDVIHYRHANVAMFGGVHAMHVAVMEAKGDKAQQCLVLAPENWVEMFEAEPLMQWGALIMTGSQVVDHFNGRLKAESSQRLMNRGIAYEAELLASVDRTKLNDYQREVLRRHPHGFDARFDYPYRDVSSSVA